MRDLRDKQANLRYERTMGGGEDKLRDDEREHACVKEWENKFPRQRVSGGLSGNLHYGVSISI